MDLTIHWFGGPFGLRHDRKRAVYGTADRDRHEAAEATEAGATGLALAAGVPVFTLAKIMGTSVRRVERCYGCLLDGAGAGIAGRLDAFDAEQEREGRANESPDRR